MQADAKALGLNIPLVSGYRSYETQEKLYNKYVKKMVKRKLTRILQNQVSQNIKQDLLLI